ncbi:MAG: AAA family ATPase [Microthrixaceae bacterium]
MRLVWVTGISGAGKSTVCDVLKSRGVAAVDTDWDGFNRWVDRASGDSIVDPPHPTPVGWMITHSWQIRSSLVHAIADADVDDTTFLFGAVENESEVWDRFTHVGCLIVDDDTLRHRLTTRTTNSFGKHPAELDQIVGWNRDVEAKYRALGASIIDATRPLDDVVADVLALSPR